MFPPSPQARLTTNGSKPLQVSHSTTVCSLTYPENHCDGGLPYIGDRICIRQVGGCSGYQAFVSKWSNSNGDDKWYHIADNFGPAGQWNRSGWEVAAIANSSDSDRRGFYVNSKNATVYITIRSLENIEVVTARRP
ncbi:uncharacterized protein PHACADRAFT_248199 [Phanerochaete carnosa HHB-10118-sp]|uniref:Uncharacterized protein n=1 Tax=Phanerochaete carnosa (strain HHB-10118-sp) TaxID=650164 RepID=K5XEM0_PHACS|nr:uncharacterized protein PHACADRAFT_248199 [Phanerochaete carnosa HHB-10118-sp]EKM61527.1 hypothetical protein PHACADRAFT_248199 [Phanerochaete carnosa HHB-10118-sp]